MQRILILPDIRSAGYPANLKAGFRISGRIYNSTFKCLEKYEINKDIRFIEGFLFPYLNQHFLDQSSTGNGSKKPF
jgi:hypothetical protein